ncbi:MAG: U32 family peptidase [Lachnospiraceae bacterium]|nr:U32 family peptidase [Lachnospiraceae bacterium]
MVNKKVELLAPAGDYQCCMAAINAGADAVYLGGFKFGARAYANNFSKEEIIEALRVAHLFGRKIYLAVNTLVKENEMPELVPYIAPLYEAGLDGVIVQDIGVMKVLKENFPELLLHASTQMTITGVYGAEFVKQLGACRAVPARELSLAEIKDIKVQTGLEIECFIHGAMCYAYSGQCLFSSILGGRSGNRGRCAGPCRLPYTDESGKRLYPLSLKDMYTLSEIPKLIEAGIDSFKIEGRMKSAEYVAGVTSVYRKYIDKYLTTPNEAYCVSEQDETFLRGLYIRSDICHGYYEKHRDKSMITIKEPGYNGSTKETLAEIRKRYIDKKITLAIKGNASVFAGKTVLFTLFTDDVSVTVEGDVAGEALNRPLMEKDIADKLSKFGDTCFSLMSLTVDTDNKAFLPVKSLNELRRKACAALEDALLKQYDRGALSSGSSDMLQAGRSVQTKKCDKDNALAVLVTTREQLEVALLYDQIKILYINADIFTINKTELEKVRDKQYFLALPHIFRKRSYPYQETYRALLESGLFLGVLVRNFEELQWLHSIDYNGQIVSDYTIYTWNNISLRLCADWFDRVTLPVELNKKELSQLSDDVPAELLVYGRLPLMYSANCVRNTLEKCINQPNHQNVYRLTDRYKNTFPVVQNCMHCYNILYNTVPLSLHNQLESIQKRGYDALRLDFTLEDDIQTKSVIEYYIKKSDGAEADFIWKDFTNGHYKRGVE